MNRIDVMEQLLQIPATISGKHVIAVMYAPTAPYYDHKIIAGAYITTDKSAMGIAMGDNGVTVTKEPHRKEGIYLSRSSFINYDVKQYLKQEGNTELPKGPFGRKSMYVVKKGLNHIAIYWDREYTYHPGYRKAILDKILKTKARMSPLPKTAVPLGHGAYLLPDRNIIVDKRGKTLKEETERYRKLMETEGYPEEPEGLHPLQADAAFAKMWRSIEWKKV